MSININYDPCFSCGGPYHPATGDYDRFYDIKRCGVCMSRFIKWFISHSKRRWGKVRFYDEALTSIKPNK